jgi:hypothetical protein
MVNNVIGVVNYVIADSLAQDATGTSSKLITLTPSGAAASPAPPGLRSFLSRIE